MDLDAKNDINDDDEIIELTDIIETGKKAKPAAPDTTGDDLDALIGDLGNAKAKQPNIPSDTEADIDALLAQMDSDSEPPKATTQQPSENEQNNSDEPDTSDVDALLASMDMPPQPSDDASPAADADEDSSADMDALLESILDDAPEAKPAKAKAPKAQEPADDPIPTLDESADARDILDDLDDLLKEVDNDTEAAISDTDNKKANKNVVDFSDIDDVLNDVGIGESDLTAGDIAESLLPPVRKGKSGDTLSDNIMDAIDVMTDNLEAAPDFDEKDNTSSQENSLDADLDDIDDLLAAEFGEDEATEVKTELDAEALAELELESELMAEFEAEVEAVAEPVAEPAAEPEAVAEPVAAPEPALAPEPEAEAVAEPEPEPEPAAVAEPKPAPAAVVMDTVLTSGSHIDAAQSLAKAPEQAELLAHIERLEKRIVDLEEQLTNNLESLAAKAAAKIIREEIAALLSEK